MSCTADLLLALPVVVSAAPHTALLKESFKNNNKSPVSYTE